MTGYGSLMAYITRFLPLVLFMVASPVDAQSAEGNEPIGLEPAQEGAGGEGGSVYIGAVYGDWEVRCIGIESSPDSCQLYQLLADNSGNPVAEINIFPVSGDAEFVAGTTVVTPLETLLTEGLEVSVDGGEVRSHPFLWCSAVGCVSRIGLTQADLAALKAGSQVRLSIVPARAPSHRVNLTVSLTGLTAGFNDVVARSDQ